MSSRPFDLEKPHLYEIWMNSDNTEWSLFCPEEQTKKSLKFLTKDLDGYRMTILASIKCTYQEAKDVSNDLMLSIDDYGFLEKKE